MSGETEEIQSELLQTLRGITPNFEENLKRAFKNEAVRLQRKQDLIRHTFHLDDVLLDLGDSKIELRTLKFPWIPDFRILEMSVDLPMSCLDVSLNLGNLQVEGSYEANNSTLRKWLPISHVGRITIGFNNVRASGKIGLTMDQDSLVPHNYDITYQPSDVTVRVSYHVDADNVVENEISHSDIEATLGKTIWVQLTETLANLLREQLGEVVIEFSATELLIDKDEEFREYNREQSSRANKLLDSLLCSAKDYLVAQKLRSLSTPAFDAVYKGRLSGVQQGTFQTGEGFLEDLSTLSRVGDFSLYEDKHKLTIYGAINLRDFKHGYQHYRSVYGETSIEGAIKASVYKNNIFLKISVQKEGERCNTVLESLQVKVVGDIDVDVSGLASLSWLNERLKGWVVGTLRQRALPVLENHIKEALLHAILNTDCIALLAD